MNGLIRQAVKIIKDISYINIASVTPDGKPWNSPVYCAFDNNLNFYWLSWKLNQHSENIRNNPNVFITIYDSTVPSGTGYGVYFAGKAYELNNPIDMLLGLKQIYERERRSPKDVIFFLKKFPRRVYKFIPEKAWINGEGEIEGEYIDNRTELNLEELKNL